MSGIPVSRYRWFILAVFVLSTTISYLDRQMLAALAPTVQGEFGLSDTQYGLLLTAFSIPLRSDGAVRGAADRPHRPQ